jgi:Polyketide cyclase / dehydrase and lipid transport
MATIHVTSMIPAPVERVWEYVRDFNGLPKWFPGVTDSHIEPGALVNQAGCIRNFGLAGGPRIREQLLALSDHDHRWSYKMLDSPLPIGNYVATVRLSAGDGNATLAEITSQFDVPPAQENEVVGLLTTTYGGAFALLNKHFEKEAISS